MTMTTMIGKACLLLPYIILEFLQLLGFGACIILTVGPDDDDDNDNFAFCITLTLGADDYDEDDYDHILFT